VASIHIINDLDLLDERSRELRGLVV